MDLRTATPFWLLRSGLIGTWPALERDTRCDVAIIGAGITGALLAHALTAEGADVVVLDRREAVLGSTVASTGLLLYETDTQLHDLAGRVGVAGAVRSWQLGREAVAHLGALARTLGDGDWTARETLYFASRRSHASRLRREFDMRRRHGFDVELLDRSDLDGRPDAECAILSRGNAEIDPFRFAHALLDAACAAGARVYDRSEASDFVDDARGVTIRTDRDACVRCRHVVFATGYESERYLGRSIGDLNSTFVAVSEPIAGFEAWPERRLIWETARPYTYLRSTPDGRAMVGGADRPYSRAHARRGMITRRAQRLASRALRILPDLRFETAFAWGGTFGSTPDGLPRIGPDPRRPGRLFALGYGGNGITFAAIAAGILADRIAGRPNPDAHLFRLDR